MVPDHGGVALLRPGVRVRNETPFPDWEVRCLVERSMRGDRRTPPQVIVHYRKSPTDDREGFTPFDRSRPIDLWVEPAARYPEPGAKTWQMELALSAAHEDYHFRHPGQPCPHDSCERLAEAYAQEHFRMLQRRQRYAGCRR